MTKRVKLVKVISAKKTSPYTRNGTYKRRPTAELQNSEENAHSELQKTLSELKNILNSSSDVICTINSKREFVSMNAASKKIWGYRPDELIGTRFTDLVYSEDKNITLKLVLKVLRGNTLPSFENRYRHISGKPIPMLWSINWDEKQQLAYCIGKDITEKKRLQKAIENERDRFYQMFLQAPSAIGLLKGPELVFEMANPLYLASIGQKDVIGKRLTEVLPELESQGTIERLKNVYRTGNSHVDSEKLVKIEHKETGEIIDFYIDFIYQAYRNEEGEIEGVLFFINNITEQVLSRKRIEKSEKRYRQIVETAQEGIWLLDENHQTSFVNKKMCEILGYSEEEIMSKDPLEFLDPETKEKEIASLKRRKKGIAENFELDFISKKGNYVHTTISANPIFDNAGIYEGSLRMISDFTEKKHLEELLEKSNRLARIGSWEIDVDNGTVYWSDITKEIREAGPNFVPDLSTGIGFFSEGRDQEIISQRVKECIDSGTPWDEELQLTTFKGNKKWVRTIGQAVYKDGKCSKIYGSFQDISIRKHAEQSLQQSQSNLKAILENTEAGIYSLDTKLRYIAFNKLLHDNLQEIFDLDIKIGDRVFGFMNKLKLTNSKNWKEKYNRGLRGETLKFEDELIIDNSSRFFSFSINPIWENDKIIGLSCFVYDITQQKHEQRQKEKLSADLIQRNKDLEQFTFIISHNLRAPAANIIGYADSLLDEPITPKERKELLNGLSSSVAGLDSIIKDLNSIILMKQEVNKQKEKIVLSKVVHTIKANLSHLIENNHFHIHADFSEVDEIYSLKVYIYSIFYNLISNSIRYANPNVSPVLKIKSIKENDKLIFTFTDNGLGIDLETKANLIFGLYKRFHSHVKGKGMGLFMVKTQVELLGGEINVASELNKGTKFTIVFHNQ